jgi:tetratricopeptide (TPR) repeat protein
MRFLFPFCAASPARAPGIAGVLTLAIGLLFCPALAHAQEPAPAESGTEALKLAREQFSQAIALQTAGDWAGALALLKQVAAVKSTPHVRFNIALCEERLGRLVAALGDYELAAADARAEKADQVAEEVEARREALSQRIPKLTVKRGAGAEAASISVDGVALGDQVIGIPMPTDPGPHTIEATAPGFKPFRKSVRVAERQSEVIEIELEAEPVPQRPDVPPNQRSSGRSPIYGYVVGGIGIASLGASGVFFGLRADKISDLEEVCPGNICPPGSNDDIERGKLYTTIGNITLAVGVAAVAGGVVLVLTSGSGDETAKAPRKTYPKLALAPAPGGAQLIGNF